MDTMKLLLGATIALLLGALAVSWQGMKTGVRNTPPDELARLEKQIKELRAETDKFRLEKELIKLRSEPAPVIGPSTAELEAIKLQVEKNKIALAEMDQQAKEKRDKKLEDMEEVEMAKRGLESKDSELRRARMISDALLVGRVKEFVEDPQSGAFIILEVLLPEQVQTGAILAIRRKTGILGQFKVSDVTPEGAIANPLPGFGPVEPKIGDELILPPQY
jgi:hypothetical protein